MTLYQHAYVLNVLSDDHPGIVAAVGDAIESLRGNIDSCSQTVLRGYFTLIMVVSLPESIDPEELARRVVAAPDRRTGLQVMARPFDQPSTAQDVTGEKFVITAFGEDTPGVLHRFSQYLAGKDINIVDLFGERTGEEFVLISEVQIPPRWDIAMLQAELLEMGRELGFNVRLQHEDIFVATNQLRLRRIPPARSPGSRA